MTSLKLRHNPLMRYEYIKLCTRRYCGEANLGGDTIPVPDQDKDGDWDRILIDYFYCTRPCIIYFKNTRFREGYNKWQRIQYIFSDVEIYDLNKQILSYSPLVITSKRLMRKIKEKREYLDDDHWLEVIPTGDGIERDYQVRVV